MSSEKEVTKPDKTGDGKNAFIKALKSVFPAKRCYINKAILVVMVIAALFLLQYHWHISSYLDQKHINRVLVQSGPLAPLAYVFIMILVAMSPFPNMPMDIAAGAFFGPLQGTLYSVTGTLGGAVISFTITRLLGRELIERFLGGHINFCIECSDKLLTKIVFFSRLFPIFSIDIVSYGSGLTKLSLKRFGLATFFGLLPLALFYNYFGSVLVVRKSLAIALGLVMAVLFFFVPKLLERKNIFHLRSNFEHLDKIKE
jgi:uncharacterized membrane protein YdjX (TVP38/TMEM64 family)